MFFLLNSALKYLICLNRSMCLHSLIKIGLTEVFICRKLLHFNIQLKPFIIFSLMDEFVLYLFNSNFTCGYF